MEIGMGQRYALQLNNPTILATNSAAAILDILTITAAAGIPVYLEWLRLTASINQAQNVPINAVLRSSAGTGGSTSLVSAVNESPAGPTLSSTLAYQVTAVGALLKTFDTADWQLFGQYVLSREPGGLLIPPGQTFALSVPQNGIGSNIVVAVAAKFTEVK